MGKKKYVTWVVEFICITAIAFIFSQADYSNYIVFAPIVIILGLKFFEYRVTLSEKHLTVHVQLDLLVKLLSYETSLNVRCTYHVPVWRKRLLQTCDYIPTGGGSGRKFSVEKGIIGKAVIEKRPLVVNFETDEEYREKMVTEFKYTPDELQQRSADRKSYFCYPIVDESHKVLGLVFFDSSRPYTFKLDEKDEKTNTIIQACEAIKAKLI